MERIELSNLNIQKENEKLKTTLNEYFQCNEINKELKNNIKIENNKLTENKIINKNHKNQINTK
jgi:hypothetical protein